MHVIKSKKEKITLYYGKQTLNGKPYNHTGIDIIRKPYYCDYIIAAQEGKVVAVVKNIRGFVNNSYGNYVMLEHGNGVRTLYAHMKYGTVRVSKGQVVKAGTVLGYMGATGSAYGAHLHFEVRVNNKCVNPLPYLDDKKSIEPYNKPTPKPTTEEKYIVTPKIGVNIRAGAGIKYKIVGAYKYKTKITVTEKSGVWGKTNKGWVCLTYCKKI